MNSQDLFDQFYSKNMEAFDSKSLLSFFEKIVRPRLNLNIPKILELGSGDFSFFEDVLNLQAEITAIDFSEAAIAKAPRSKIKYKLANILESQFFNDSYYDLVFDSHCLNCLTNETERTLALKNIYTTLKTNGHFASELMIQPEGQRVSMPFKNIKTALELEQEIISSGLKIIYFTISRESGFSQILDGNEINCDLLQVIAKK